MRVHLYHKLPTPYNDMLFRTLHNDGRTDLTVYHLWKSRENRPWTVELATGYKNYYLNTNWLGVDWNLLRIALTDKQSFFLVGDWAYPSSIIVLIARIALNLPVSIWADTPQEHLPRPWYKRVPRKLFLSWLLPRMDIVFGTGRPGTRILKEMGVTEKKIVDLPCFVDLSLPSNCRSNEDTLKKSHQFRNLVGCQDDGVVFLMSGMCTYKKGQDIGIRAFAKLFNHIKNVNVGLLIAGEGPDRKELETLAKELKVSEKVVFLGWLDPDDMNAAYLSSNIVMHPSRWDQFPLVILEAMSWGKVVIGSDACGSVQDRIISGQNGFAFPSEDVNALAKILVEITCNSQLRQAISLKARETAELWPVRKGVDTIIQTAQRVISSKK